MILSFYNKSKQESEFHHILSGWFRTKPACFAGGVDWGSGRDVNPLGFSRLFWDKMGHLCVVAGTEGFYGI